MHRGWGGGYRLWTLTSRMSLTCVCAAADESDQIVSMLPSMKQILSVRSGEKSRAASARNRGTYMYSHRDMNALRAGMDGQGSGEMGAIAFLWPVGRRRGCG